MDQPSSGVVYYVDLEEKNILVYLFEDHLISIFVVKKERDKFSLRGTCVTFGIVLVPTRHRPGKHDVSRNRPLKFHDLCCRVVYFMIFCYLIVFTSVTRNKLF